MAETVSVALPASAHLRRVRAGDEAALLDAYLRNRDHLRPFDPPRRETFWTLTGQARRLDSLLQRQAAGSVFAGLILRGGQVLGCATLDTIVRGPFRSANLGYWIDAGQLRQGLAGAAVAAIVRIADEDLGLHRIQAGTLPINAPSQRVLIRNNFREIGIARDHLFIDGRWQDHRLFERILNDRPATPH